MSNNTKIWQAILIPLLLVISLILSIFFFPEIRAILIIIYISVILVYVIMLIFLAVHYKPSLENSVLRFVYFFGPLILLIVSLFGIINSIIDFQVEMMVFWIVSFVLLINLYVWLIISAISGKHREKMEEKIHLKYAGQLGNDAKIEKVNENFKNEPIILKTRNANFLVRNQ